MIIPKREIFGKNVYLEIYTIGYSLEGESNIVILKNNNVCIFCGIIDCYSTDSLNYTKKILESENISKLDFLCWTHPDKDHSVGLECFIDYLKPEYNSVILLSQNFLQHKKDYEKANSCFSKFMFDWLKKSVRVSKRVKVCSVLSELPITEFCINDIDEYVFSITGFTPTDQITQIKTYNENQSKNDMSVGLLISFAGKTVLLTGDATDISINNVDDNLIPDLIDLLKIPHHCSENGSAIIKKMKTKTKIACTTSFSSEGLPNKEVLKKYKINTDELYCTLDLMKDEQADEYGCVKFTYNLTEDECNIELFGNAILVDQFEG